MLYKLRTECEFRLKKYTVFTGKRTYLINHWTNQHLDISQKLHTALKNVEIAEEKLGIPIKNRGTIEIVSKKIEYSGLYDSENDLILIDQTLVEIGPTIFHELIHYFYPGLFGHNSLGGYLQEGLSVFYERQFYPYSWTDIQLLQDRINEEYPLYSVGYFLFNSFFDDIVKSLQSVSPASFFDELNSCAPEFELSHFKKHLSDNVLFFDMKADDPTCVLFSWDLKSPYIIHLSKDCDPAKGISFSNQHDLKIHQSNREDWEELIKLILPLSQRIKPKYQFYSAQESLRKWRQYEM